MLEHLRQLTASFTFAEPPVSGNPLTDRRPSTTTTLHSDSDVSPRPARALPWYAFGLANLAVVVVLSLVTWYLFLDPRCIRGHRSDYDGWAAAGNPGWSYADVLPHFIELEDHETGASDHHGAGGPLHVSTLRDKAPNPTSTAFVAACLERGHPGNDDLNGATLEGAGFGPVSIKDGVRQDSWTCFLAPVVGRAGLTVRTGAQVGRLLVDGDRVTGVELAGGERVEAAREVILCAGAIDSPRLLLQSGIGPADELRGLGINVVRDLLGVGRNLHDHVLLGVVYEARQELPPGRNNLSESVLFTHGSAGLPAPDIQIALVHVPFHSAEFTAPSNSYTIAPGIVYPRSRGSVRLLGRPPAARSPSTRTTSATTRTWPGWSRGSPCRARSGRPTRSRRGGRARCCSART